MRLIHLSDCDGQALYINPEYVIAAFDGRDRDTTKLMLVSAGDTEDNILQVRGELHEVVEDLMVFNV